MSNTKGAKSRDVTGSQEKNEDETATGGCVCVCVRACAHVRVHVGIPSPSLHIGSLSFSTLPQLPE